MRPIQEIQSDSRTLKLRSEQFPLSWAGVQERGKYASIEGKTLLSQDVNTSAEHF